MENNDEIKKFIEKLKQKKSEIKKINVEDLPYDEQEIIKEMIEMFGLDEMPDLYSVEIEFEIDDLNIIPSEYLKEFFKEMIKKDEFEKAEEVLNILNGRGIEANFSKNNNEISFIEK